MARKVLVEDDSQIARMVMASALRRLRPEWGSIEASGADDALHVIANGAVDVVLIER